MVDLEAVVWVCSDVEPGNTGMFAAADALAVDLGDRRYLQVSEAGDLDRDGIADLLIRTTSEIHTYSGVSLSNTPQRIGSIEGVWDEQDAVANADVDGDGLLDSIVGDSSVSSESALGAVYVLLAVRSGPSEVGIEDADGSFEARGSGGALASGEDVDGDGVVDVLVGGQTNPGADGWGGAAWVLTGSDGWDGAIVPFATVLGRWPNNGLGSAVELADVMGDSATDLILTDVASEVGTYRSDGGGGELLIFEGSMMEGGGTWLGAESSASWAGFDASLSVGQDVMARGDQDGDGRVDLVVSDDHFPSNTAGAAFVLLTPP